MTVEINTIAGVDMRLNGAAVQILNYNRTFCVSRKYKSNFCGYFFTSQCVSSGESINIISFTLEKLIRI